MVDQTKVLGFLGAHEVIAITRLFHHVIRLAGVMGQDLVQAFFQLEHVFDPDLHIAGLAFRPAQHDGGRMRGMAVGQAAKELVDDGRARAVGRRVHPMQQLVVKAQEAVRRGAELVVAHAWVTQVRSAPLATRDSTERGWAQRVLREAVDSVRAAHPTLAVTGRLIAESPVPAYPIGQTTSGAACASAALKRLLKSACAAPLGRSADP